MAQEPAPRPTLDERAPDQMPSAGTVEWYDATRSVGVLVTSDGARVTFDGDVLKRRKSVLDGSAVTIEWKRARAGAWNVPALVTQAGVPGPAPTFTLDQWLVGFHKRTGKLKRLTAKALSEEEGVDQWDGTEDRAWMLLRAIGEMPGQDRWIRSFDWKDGEAHAAAYALVGKGEELFSLATGGDNYVVIVLPPQACAQLVADRYIKTQYIDPPPAQPSREKKRGLLGRLFG